MAAVKQIPTVVLPQIAPLGTEAEVVADALVHTSLSFPVDSLQEKTVYILATNAGAAALNVQVELAPADIAAAYAPVGAVTILAVTGNVLIPWTIHSSFARVTVQCPAWAAGFWALQVVTEGKGA